MGSKPIRRRCMGRRSLFSGITLLLLVSCANPAPTRDLVHETYPEAQGELREVVDTLAEDAMTANIDGLQGLHLNSPKFTKFGPRTFERQDVGSTNESEAAFFGSVSDMTYEAEDLKIDVFGDVGIVTYYPRVTFGKDGERVEVRGRQTLVFLKTSAGWRIVHEHGTIRE
jgi:hypothetical protein